MYVTQYAKKGLKLVNMVVKSKTWMSVGAILVLMVSLVGCKPTSEQQVSSPQAMPPMPVTLLTMSPQSVPITTEAVGQTEGAKAVEVRPRVGGILLKKHFDEGASIKKGQLMFSIDPDQYQMVVDQNKAQLAHQQARVTQTERESTRLKQLLATQSISQREYDNAISDHAMAKADLLSAEVAVHQAELDLSYATVRAPSNGVAGRFLLSEGALVSANTTLLTTIIKTSPIWVRFSLSEHELAQLGGMLDSKSIEKISLTLPDGAEYPESGKLNFSASEIDPALGTQQLRASFTNKDNALVPGQFVRVKITTGSQSGVFLVPQQAVLTGEYGKFVWTAQADEKGDLIATPKPIKVGAWHGTDWVILDGLEVEDKVILDNLIKIRPGAKVVPKDQKPNTQSAK